MNRWIAFAMPLLILGNGTAEGSTLPWLNDDLVAYYSFNGDADDASGNLRHGVATDLSFTADRFGTLVNAGYFNGSTAKVVLPDENAFRFQQHTISFWMKYEKGQTLVSKEPWLKSHGYVVRELVDIQDSPLEHMIAAGGVQSNQGGVYRENKAIADLSGWKHVVATFDGNLQSLYLNGMVISQLSSPSFTITHDTEQVVIGNFVNSIPSSVSSANQHRVFGGAIDDLRFYSTALSASQVSELFNFESVPEPTTSALALAALCLAMSRRRAF